MVYMMVYTIDLYDGIYLASMIYMMVYTLLCIMGYILVYTTFV